MSLGKILLFVSTAGIFLVALVAVLGHPPPLYIPVSMFAGYLAVLLLGVLNLRLKMFGDALCEVEGVSARLALTFDDGPDPLTTPIVLRLLKARGVKATFFVIGKKAEQHPDLLRQIVAEGHELGVHSYDHNRLYAFLPPREVEADIEKTRDVIEAAVGHRPLWFRPPIAQMSPRTAAGVLRAKAEVVGYSVRARDGLSSADPDLCAERVLRGAKAGAIVLLHDARERADTENILAAKVISDALGARGGESVASSKQLSEEEVQVCPAGVRALPEILRQLSARGLESVTVSELLDSAEV